MSLESAALINEERQLLTALEQPNRRWIKAPSIQSPNPAATFESYEYAVSAKGAPEALACLRLFIESTRLNERNGWSVSALPSWSGTTDIRRFCTVSGSVYELFFVWLYRDDGSSLLGVCGYHRTSRTVSRAQLAWTSAHPTRATSSLKEIRLRNFVNSSCCQEMLTCYATLLK